MTNYHGATFRIDVELLFQNFARLIGRYAVSVMVLIVVISAVAGWYLTRLSIDSNVAELLPRDSKTRLLIDKYMDPSNESELLVIGISHPNLLTEKWLTQVATINQAIIDIPSVIQNLTPFNLHSFQRHQGKLLIAPLSRQGKVPTSRVEIDLFLETAKGAPPLLKALFAPEIPALSLIFSITSNENYNDLLSQLQNIIARDSEGLLISIGGWIPLYETTRTAISKELPLLAFLAGLITLIVYRLSFVMFRAVILPLLAIGIALLWTFGLMSFFGVPVSMPSLMIPPLIFALGSSYSIHFLHSYFVETPAPATTTNFSESRESSQKLVNLPIKGIEYIAMATGRVSQTIVLASLTTAIGFASLLISGMERLRQFGLFSAVGIIICALVTLLLFPAILSKLPTPTRHQKERLRHGWFAAVARLLLRLMPSRKWYVYCFLAFLIVIFLISLGTVSFQTDVSKFFRGHVKAIEDNRELMSRFGSFVDLNLTITTAPGVVDIKLLSQLAEFENVVQNHPNVSHVTSITSYLQSLNHAIYGIHSYPENLNVLRLFQRLLMINSSRESQIDALVNRVSGHVTTRIWLRNGKTLWLLSEQEMRELVDFVRVNANQIFTEEQQPELWGWSLVTLRVAEILAHEQLVSTVISLFLVLVIATIAFRSLRYGLMTLLPLVTSIMLAFIFMSLARIPLDVLTVSFAGVAIGVGVDDSIHFLLYYRRASSTDRSTAVVLTMQHTGHAILITTIAIVAGLLAMAISLFTPVVYLGMLVSITLIGATLGTLFLLPCLIDRHVTPDTDPN